MTRKYVELRVHGVSGTPPEDMLDSKLVRQVAGDHEGRFFRAVQADGSELRAPDGHIVEGYHWGPLTSGSWRQALWLVLIPFGLINAAYFMLPRADRRPRRVARGALRALGILLTAILVLSIAQALVDLVAWQWTGLVPDGQDAPRAADPRLWLAGGFAVATLSVVVLRFFGGPAHPPADEGDWRPPADAWRRTELAGGEFYTGDVDVPALQRLHLVAGVAVVSVLAAALARTYAGGFWPDVLYRVSVGLLAAAVLQAAVLGDPRCDRRGIRRFVAQVLPSIEVPLAFVVLAASFGTAMLRDNLPAAHRGVLPAVGDLGIWLAAAALLALVVLAGAAAVLAWRTPEPADVPPPFRRYLKGMAGPVVAALGVFLGVGFTAALDYGVLRLLRPAEAAQAMDLPLFHIRIAHAAGVAVVLAAVALIAVLAARRLAGGRFEAMVRAAGAGQPPDAQFRSVARAWWLGRIKYHVQWPVGAVAVVGTVLTLVAVAEAAGDLVAAGGHAANLTQCRADSWLPAWLDWLSDCRDLPGPDLVTVGTLALIGICAGLLYLGRSALRDSAIRRSACVVWDLVAFWPRTVHPLVPPPYAPKVIEDLRRRIAWHLDNCSERFVVLAGHSQGSLIAVAALTRLSAAYRSRVALLTFGSQLQIAYARAFPAYVNHAHLGWIWRDVLGTRWRSLFRETDPIGGPVLSWDRGDGLRDGSFTSRRLGSAAPGPEPDRVDERTGVRACGAEWRLPDPPPANGQDSPRWRMRRHSCYSLDPAWTRALAELVGSEHDHGAENVAPVHLLERRLDVADADLLRDEAVQVQPAAAVKVDQHREIP